MPFSEGSNSWINVGFSLTDRPTQVQEEEIEVAAYPQALLTPSAEFEARERVALAAAVQSETATITVRPTYSPVVECVANVLLASNCPSGRLIPGDDEGSVWSPARDKARRGRRLHHSSSTAVWRPFAPLVQRPPGPPWRYGQRVVGGDSATGKAHARCSCIQMVPSLSRALLALPGFPIIPSSSINFIPSSTPGNTILRFLPQTADHSRDSTSVLFQGSRAGGPHYRAGVKPPRRDETPPSPPPILTCRILAPLPRPLDTHTSVAPRR